VLLAVITAARRIPSPRSKSTAAASSRC
jgi:hypothetical protein